MYYLEGRRQMAGGRRGDGEEGGRWGIGGILLYLRSSWRSNSVWSFNSNDRRGELIRFGVLVPAISQRLALRDQALLAASRS